MVLIVVQRREVAFPQSVTSKVCGICDILFELCKLVEIQPLEMKKKGKLGGENTVHLTGVVSIA